MTIAEFMEMVEKYYGPYHNKYQREIIKSYIEDEFIEDDLPILFKRITEIFSSQYKTQPDISVVNQARREYNNEHGEFYKYANGKIEFLGNGIGITRVNNENNPREIDDIIKQLTDGKKIKKTLD